MATLKVWPTTIGRPLRVVIKVLGPVPTWTDDLVSPMILPLPEPCSVIALDIVTGVDQVNVPAGSVIESPACAKLSCRYWTLVAVPSEL